MSISKPLRPILGVVTVVAIAFLTRQQWMPRLSEEHKQAQPDEVALPVEEPKKLRLSLQARKNLGLVAKPVVPQTYWRAIQIPGTVVDRPGQSDRGITSPAVGVVSKVHAFPGDTVRPGDRLLSLRLFSEYLQSTQKQLYTATKEIQITQEELDRLQPLADKGAIAKAQIIELRNVLRRQEVILQSHRQDLLTRGLNPSQIDRVASGVFVSEIDIVAPPLATVSKDTETIRPATFPSSIAADEENIAFEVQDLNAELGQQVQAGQLLATLANHRSLYIRGHAFKREAPYLETAAQNGWKIQVEFVEDDRQHWSALNQDFVIRHLANSIDPENRTFDFFVPLINQSRIYGSEAEKFVVWRFRPGQRVRLYVPVEELKNVIVVPAAAVVREGPEAFVFQQNGDIFNRLPVQVLHEDRLNIVLANDGSVTPGLFLAQNAAASLNRVMKAQAAAGVQVDVHVHPDGTVHASH